VPKHIFANPGASKDKMGVLGPLPCFMGPMKAVKHAPSDRDAKLSHVTSYVKHAASDRDARLFHIRSIRTAYIFG